MKEMLGTKLQGRACVEETRDHKCAWSTRAAILFDQTVNCGVRFLQKLEGGTSSC